MLRILEDNIKKGKKHPHNKDRKTTCKLLSSQTQIPICQCKNTINKKPGQYVTF